MAEYNPSEFVVAAICGNWWQESTINPGIWEGLQVGANGYGLGQWSNSRRPALFEYLDENGFERDSATGQVNFFLDENYWTPNGYASRFKSLGDFLTSLSTDLTILTYAFLQGWEGIWDGSQGKRVDAANQCLNYIRVHRDDEPATGFYKGNRYLSIPERLHNAVMLYRLLEGHEVPEGGGEGGGGGGIVSGGNRKLPVWMMVRRYY